MSNIDYLLEGSVEVNASMGLQLQPIELPSMEAEDSVGLGEIGYAAIQAYSFGDDDPELDVEPLSPLSPMPGLGKKKEAASPAAVPKPRSSSCQDVCGKTEETPPVLRRAHSDGTNTQPFTLLSNSYSGDLIKSSQIPNVPSSRPLNWNKRMKVAVKTLRKGALSMPTSGLTVVKKVCDRPVPWALYRLVAQVEFASAVAMPDLLPDSEWCFPTSAQWKASNLNAGSLDGVSRVIMYVHGGGFCLCRPASHRELITRLTDWVASVPSGPCQEKSPTSSPGTPVLTLAIQYGRPPQIRYPGPGLDCLRAYLWLVRQLKGSSKIILAGDSAGGALCVELLVSLRDRGLDMPLGAVLLSPWVDLVNTTDISYTEHAAWDYFIPRLAKIFSAAYADGDHTSAASVINQDLSGLPPLLVEIGGAECLRDQCIRFVEKAIAAGVDVDSWVAPEMVHGFQIFAFTGMWQPLRSYERIRRFMHRLWLSAEYGLEPQRTPSKSIDDWLESMPVTEAEKAELPERGEVQVLAQQVRQVRDSSLKGKADWYRFSQECGAVCATNCSPGDCRCGARDPGRFTKTLLQQFLEQQKCSET